VDPQVQDKRGGVGEVIGQRRAEGAEQIRSMFRQAPMGLELFV